MGSHMLQHVRGRLKGLLTQLIHADLAPAVFTCHKRAACNVSGRGVHALTLRFIGGGCWGIGTPAQSLAAASLVLPSPERGDRHHGSVVAGDF